MTFKTWFGGTGRFNNPADWLPSGAPQSGDTAVIDTGTVKLHNQALHGITIELLGASQASEPVLDLRNVWLDSDITQPGAGYADIKVSGLVVSSGTTTLNPLSFASSSRVTMDLDHHSAFVNLGTMTTDYTHENPAFGTLPTPSLEVNAPGGDALFVNDGTVVDRGNLRVNAPVVGNGQFNLQGAPYGGGVAEFVDGVGVGIKVNVNQGGNLVLDKPAEFLGGIHFSSPDFRYSSHITLPNTDVTSVSFADNKLDLFGPEGLIAKLNILDNLQTSNFHLTNENGIGRVISVTPLSPTAIGATLMTTTDPGSMLVPASPG